ncbi:TG isoform 11, partial [Pan troglodytes]
GIQMCSEENGGAWRILDCGSPDIEVHTYPFGWYQKPIAQNNAPSFCPLVVLPSLTEKVRKVREVRGTQLKRME